MTDEIKRARAKSSIWKPATIGNTCNCRAISYSRDANSRNISNIRKTVARMPSKAGNNSNNTEASNIRDARKD
jgi:hypothetical protein